MKKIFAALSALAIVGMIAVGCGKPTPKPKPEPNKTEVTELSVAPTSVSMSVGETKKFSLTEGDIIVTLKPATASYELTTSDAAVVSVEGKVITAKKVGDATITVKAGSKTATVTVKVADKAKVDESLYMGDVYVPKAGNEDFEPMKDAKMEIKTAMEAKEWENKPFYSDDQEQNIAFQFLAKEGAQKAFGTVAYYHSPQKGSQFILLRTFVEAGTWANKELMKKLLEQYGFTSNVDTSIKFPDGKQGAVAYNIERKVAMLLLYNGEKTGNNGSKYDDIEAQIFVATPKQKAAYIRHRVMDFNPLMQPVRIF